MKTKVLTSLSGALLCLFCVGCAARGPAPAEPTPEQSPLTLAIESPTAEPTAVPTKEPVILRDVTGNGVIDEVDELAMQLHADGRLPDLEALPALLQDSLLGEAYFDRFCYDGVEQGDGYYRSARVSVTLETTVEEDLTYSVADVYVRDLSCFRTLIAEDAFGRYNSEPVVDMAARAGAIVAISGDYYSARPKGPVVRNGELYRDSIDTSRDVCILYNDGTMETYAPREVDMEAATARGIYQAWSFGPGLLDEEGQPKTRFLSDVKGANPRSAVGYYKPGHYCLVVVDGRGQGGSAGLNMQELSQLFASLGCRAAYNFDGGATAVMADAEGMISRQSKTSRECSDILYVVDDWSSGANGIGNGGETGDAGGDAQTQTTDGAAATSVAGEVAGD